MFCGRGWAYSEWDSNSLLCCTEYSVVSQTLGVIDLTQLNLTNDSKDAGKTSSEKVSFLVYALDDQIYLLKVFCFCWLVFYIREYFFGIISFPSNCDNGKCH